MKKTITILLILIGFRVSAQTFEADKKINPKYVGSEWKVVKEYFNLVENPEVNDSVMMVDRITNESAFYERIETKAIPIGDTLYKFTDNQRIKIYRSGKGVREREVKKYIDEMIDKPIIEQLISLLQKAKGRNLSNDDKWEHPAIKELFPVQQQDTIPE